MVPGSRHHGHLAEGPGPGLVTGRAEQVGELLDEGAAEEDVQDLVTPADGEQRKVALEGGVEQLELELVPELAHAAVAAVGLLAVALGGHVATADDHESVDRVHQRAHHAGHGHRVALLGHPVGQRREAAPASHRPPPPCRGSTPGTRAASRSHDHQRVSWR